MKRSARVAPLAMALAPALTGCVVAACPRGGVCGTTAWAPAEATRVEGAMVLAPAVDVAAPGLAPGALSERLPVRGDAPTIVRFDPSALPVRGAAVERAVLSLSPHPSWRPSGARVLLVARAVGEARSGATASPILASDPTAEASLPGASRAPVRLDVTTAVRAWLDGEAAPALALATDGAPVVFEGPFAGDEADRPRLEVELR